MKEKAKVQFCAWKLTAQPMAASDKSPGTAALVFCWAFMVMEGQQWSPVQHMNAPLRRPIS